MRVDLTLRCPKCGRRADMCFEHGDDWKKREPEATGAVLTACQRSALPMGQEICRDFHGAELEPFQLALIETLGVTPVNYEPVGPVRETARARVAECLKHGPRFPQDRLYEKAALWLYESGQR